MDAKEAKIYLAVIIAAGVLAVILVYFIFTILNAQKRMRQLHASKLLAEITTLEKERKRIAADLHDELGPIVVGIKLKLNSLDENEENKVLLTGIHRNITELIERLKTISNDLLPLTLVKKGLAETMKLVVSELNRTKAIHVVFQHDDLPPLPETMSVNIYRILQEIIHNTLKHAQAKQLYIVIKVKSPQLELFTTDDGVGFDKELEAINSTGLGLRNIVSRVELLKGTIYLESKPDMGTRYLIEIPLPV